MWPSRLILTVVALAISSPALARQIPPRDECSNAEDFGPFYRHFKDVVARRDAKALIALIPVKGTNPNVVGLEPDSFVQTWKLHNGKSSLLWRELDNVLNAGCAQDGSRYFAPYTQLWLSRTATKDDLDMVVYGKANLYAAPTESSRVLARLDWDVVRPWKPIPVSISKWAAVIVANGTKGYVPSAALRDVFDYQAEFALVHGQWSFTYFGASD